MVSIGYLATTRSGVGVYSQRNTRLSGGTGKDYDVKSTTPKGKCALLSSAQSWVSRLCSEGPNRTDLQSRRFKWELEGLEGLMAEKWGPRVPATQL